MRGIGLTLISIDNIFISIRPAPPTATTLHHPTPCSDHRTHQPQSQTVPPQPQQLIFLASAHPGRILSKPAFRTSRIDLLLTSPTARKRGKGAGATNQFSSSFNPRSLRRGTISWISFWSVKDIRLKSQS
jgi:hypothetical protein